MNPAIDALLALTTVALRAAEAAQIASQIIARAQAEGRDLTPEEIGQVQALRESAMTRWEAAKG